MIKQTNSVQAKHAPLLGLFLNGYENMRQKMDAPCRRPLLEIAPLVFGKWYYAALAKETILSPANLFALDLQKDSDAKIEYAYIMNTKAAEEQSDLEFTSEYHFSLMTYSTQKHPLVADLQALISYCTPDRATDENGMLLEEEKKGNSGTAKSPCRVLSGISHPSGVAAWASGSHALHSYQKGTACLGV